MARLIYWWWAPVAVALAAVIGWETNWGESLTRPLLVAQAPEARPVTPALLPEYKSTAGPEAYAEVIDRPLFSPTRKPAPPPPQPEPPKPQMQMGQYQLTGTIQVGDKLYAFLKDAKTGKGVRAAQGDLLASGVKLAKVEPDRVVFSQFDSEEEVKLVVSKSRGPTPTAPPPGAPGAPGTPGAPGVPGAPVPPGPGLPATPSIQPGSTPPAPRTAIAAPGAPNPVAPPGAATMAPFVPGVSQVQRTDGAPNSIRRRGVPQ